MSRSVASESAAAPLLSSVRERLATVVISHPVVDAYAGFVPPLLGVLQVRCDLTDFQAASLLSIGPITSGLSQPLFAWLTDRIDSRWSGGLGLAVAAASLSCIGLAGSFTALVVLFAIGMLGVGAFHPVAAASIGQLSGRRRSAGVTVFFVAGMIGATMGPILSTRITAIDPNGFDLLRWMMVPGLIVAVCLHLAIRNVPHRHHEHHAIRFEPSDVRQRWHGVFLLFAGNAMRYSVNIALLYLFVRWAEALVAREQPLLTGEEIARAGSLYCGGLNATMMLGMGVGGMSAGLYIRAGREKLPFIFIPLLLAPAIALFPQAGRTAGYALALVAGMSYGAVIPLTISLAQRLLPHRTSLASSLTMGGAWAVATLAPPTADWCLNKLGMAWSFRLVAMLLALSGFISVFLPGGLLRRVAGEHVTDAE